MKPFIQVSNVIFGLSEKYNVYSLETLWKKLQISILILYLKTYCQPSRLE